MCVGAALAAAGTLTSLGETTTLPMFSTASASTAHQVHTVNPASAVLGLVVGTAPWLWMAWKTSTGRGWARVLSTFFFNITTTAIVVTLVWIGSTPHRTVTISPSWAGFFAIAEWGAGLTAVILLWAPDSGDYFRACKLARAMASYLPPYGYGPPPYGPPPYGPPQYSPPRYPSSG